MNFSLRRKELGHFSEIPDSADSWSYLPLEPARIKLSDFLNARHSKEFLLLLDYLQEPEAESLLLTADGYVVLPKSYILSSKL
jgi:hypothetical protein